METSFGCGIEKRKNHYSFVASCPESAVFRHVRSIQKEQFNNHRGVSVNLGEANDLIEEEATCSCWGAHPLAMTRMVVQRPKRALERRQATVNARPRSQG